MNRPAEKGAVAGALALLIARLAGIHDVNTVTAIGVAIGFVPGAITWTVELFRRRSVVDDPRRP